MVIMYQKDQGLNQGIQQAGSILGSVLMQQAQERKLQQEFSNINRKIQGQPLTPTLLQQILAEPGGQAYLQQFGPIVTPLIQQQGQSQGDNAFLQNLLGSLTGQGIPSAPASSPIQEAQAFQQNRSSPTAIRNVPSTLSRDSNVPSVSGVPSTPPTIDSNRVGPKEQTVYQQGGQAGMGLNPPQEDASIPQGMQGIQASQVAGPSALEQLQSLSPEQKQAAALVLATHPRLKGLANILQDQEKTTRDIDAKREERNFKINAPLYEEMSSIRRTLPDQQIALDRINDALQSGDINQFTDWAAQRLGLDPLTTTQSQILDSAVKTFFVGDLQKIGGARLNQFIERNLSNALQSAGKSDAANQEITETLYTLFDITKERLKIFDKLVDTYDNAGRELPRNADKLINDSLSPFIKDKVSDLNKVRKELKEGKVKSNKAVQMRRAERYVQDNPPPQGIKYVLDPKGDIIEVPLNQLNEVMRAGGRVINE